MPPKKKKKKIPKYWTPMQHNKADQPKADKQIGYLLIVQELCESRGGRPGLSVITSLLVSVDVKDY